MVVSADQRCTGDLRLCPSGRRRGFTLVEALVASILFVFVLTSAYAAFHGVSAAQGRAEALTEACQTGRVVLQDIVHTIAGAYVSPVKQVTASAAAGSEPNLPDFASGRAQPNEGRATAQRGRSQGANVLGLPPTVIGSEDETSPVRRSSLTVLTRHASGLMDAADGGGLRVVSYSLETGADAGKDSAGPMRLVRDEREIGSSGGSSGYGRVRPHRLLLSDRITALRFRYLDGAIGTWQTMWRNPYGSPAAISVEVVILCAAPRHKPRAETRITMSQAIWLPRVRALAKLPVSAAPWPIGGGAAGAPPVSAGAPGGKPAGGSNSFPSPTSDLRTPQALPDAGPRLPPQSP